MKKLTLLTLFLFFSFKLFSLEEPIQEIAKLEGITFPNVYVAPSGLILTYAGNFIFLSNNNGNTWTTRYKGNNLYYEFDRIVELKDNTNNLVYFAIKRENGDKSIRKLVFSKDTCKSFSEVKIDLNGYDVYDLFSTKSNKLYLSLYNESNDVPKLISTKDFGKTITTEIDSTFIYGVNEFADSSILLTSYYMSFIKSTKDTEWRIIDKQIQAVSPKIIIAQEANSLYTSSDLGMNWKKISSLSGIDEAQKLIFTNKDDEIFACSINLNNRLMHDTTYFYKYDSKADKWNKLNSAIDKTIKPIELSNGDFILSDKRGIIIADKNFTKFNSKNIGLSLSVIQQILPINDNILLAGLFNGALFRTTDNGIIWQRVLTFPDLNGDFPFRSTLVTSKNNLIIASSDAIYFSSDNGESWSKSIDEVSISYDAKLLEDYSGNINIASYNKIYQSKDGGKTFHEVKILEALKTGWLVEADGFYVLPLESGIQVLDNDFNEVTIIMDGYTIPYLHTTSSNNVYGIGLTQDNSKIAIYKKQSLSMDVTYQVTDIPTNIFEYLPFVAISSQGDNVVCIIADKLFSLNSQNNWLNYNELIEDFCISISNNKKDIYLSSMTGKIYKWSFPTNVLNTLNKESQLKINNNIIQIKENLNFSKIEIFNNIGKLVYSSNSNSEIDMNNYNSGLYIIRIQLNNEFIIEKFIKL